MSLPMIIGYQRAADQAAVEAILQNYTHTCGYTRAWPDTIDPLLVWLLPDCPVDAVIASLKTNISNYVVAAYNNHIEDDMHTRVVLIVDEVRIDARGWLGQHTTEDIARFIGEEKRLHTLIIDELIAAGAIS